MGDYIYGTSIEVIKGDTRSLDSSSYWYNGKENGNYYSILGSYWYKWFCSLGLGA